MGNGYGQWVTDSADFALALALSFALATTPDYFLAPVSNLFMGARCEEGTLEMELEL